MTSALLLMSALAGLSVTTSPQASAQPFSDWLGVQTTLNDLSLVIASHASVADASSRRTFLDSSGQLELKTVCSVSTAAFAQQFVRKNCADDQACADRSRALARRAKILAGEVEQRLKSFPAAESPFLSPEDDLAAGPQSTEKDTLYRAAADIWLRDWALESFGNGPGPSDDNILLMRAWCGLVRETSERSLADIEATGFPSDGTPESRKIVAAFVYSAEHNAWDYSTTRRFRNAAEDTFRRGLLSPYYLVQILDTERTAFDGRQIVGSFTTCRDGRAVFDPPVVEEETGDEIRRSYNLSSSRSYLEQASRHCSLELAK